MSEIDLLRELAAAVFEMVQFDDLGQPLLCEACRPENPEPFQGARLRVHQLIEEWAARRRAEGWAR